MTSPVPDRPDGWALRSLLWGWWLILVAMLAASAAAVVLANNSTVAYQASARYVIAPAPSPVLRDAADAIDTLSSSRGRTILSTFSEIMASPTVLAAAGNELAVDGAALDDYQVTGVILPEANVIELQVLGPDAATAAALTQAIGGISSDSFIRLYPIYDVGLLDAAAIPTEPATAGLVELVALGAAAGAVLGGLFALALGAARTRRRRYVNDRLQRVTAEPTRITLIHSDDDPRSARVG